MGKSSRWATSLVAVFAVYAAACSNPQEVGEIKAKVDEIQAQQKDILAKLDGLQKGQKTILAKAPAAAPAKPSQPQEDPNKVYKIDVGDSYSKGPKDASVVLVEWSDFQ
jgi:outer membrane murein-binding lipoprotein Lpp